MKKKLLTSLAALLLFLPFAEASSSRLSLLHVKNTHTIGLSAGTGLGDTFHVGFSYQYYFHRRWSVVGFLDYERGVFEKSGFWSTNFMPGIEAAIWQPANWLYIHATAAAIVGLDHWQNQDMALSSQGPSVGLGIGLNFEFYALPQLSFTLAARQDWKYSFLSTGGTNYFSPKFSAGIRYNIQ